MPLDYDPVDAGDPSGLCQGSPLDYFNCIRDAARNSEAGRNIYHTAQGFADVTGGTVWAVAGLTGAVVAGTAGCPFQGGRAGVWGRNVAAAQKVSAKAGYAWQHPAEAAAIISVGGWSLARTATKAEAEGSTYALLGALIFDAATAGNGGEPGLARDATALPELAAVPEGATPGTQAAAVSRVAVGVGEASTEGALGSAMATSVEADTASGRAADKGTTPISASRRDGLSLREANTRNS